MTAQLWVDGLATWSIVAPCAGSLGAGMMSSARQSGWRLSKLSPKIYTRVPIPGGRRKHSIAARRLGRAVERVSGRAPDGVVWRGPVRLQRSLLPVNFEK